MRKATNTTPWFVAALGARLGAAGYGGRAGAGVDQGLAGQFPHLRRLVEGDNIDQFLLGAFAQTASPSY